MSRLDDELKIAMQRREPSPDFTARLLGRLDERIAFEPKETFWQRLAGSVRYPVFRWAALTAGAVLLIVLGIVQLSSRRAVQPSDPTVAQSGPGSGAHSPTPPKDPSASDGSTISPSPESGRPDGVNISPPRPRREHSGNRVMAANRRRETKPSAEAEAAKEKVLLALQITSETLNDAQRAIAGERTDDRPEPVHNR
jgi:hypothetical protein